MQYKKTRAVKGVSIPESMHVKLHETLSSVVKRIEDGYSGEKTFCQRDSNLRDLAGYLFETYKVEVGVARIRMPKSFEIGNLPESYKIDGFDMSKNDLRDKILNKDSNFLLMRRPEGYFIVKSFEFENSHHYVFFAGSEFEKEPKLTYVSIVSNPKGYTNTIDWVGYSKLRPLFVREEKLPKTRLRNKQETDRYNDPKIPPELLEARLERFIRKVIDNPVIRTSEMTSPEYKLLKDNFGNVKNLRNYLGQFKLNVKFYPKSSRSLPSEVREVRQSNLIKKIMDNPSLKLQDLDNKEKETLGHFGITFAEVQKYLGISYTRSLQHQKKNLKLKEISEEQPIRYAKPKQYSQNKYPDEIWEARFYNVVQKIRKNPYINREDMSNKEMNTFQKFGYTLNSLKKVLGFSDYINIKRKIFQALPEEIWEARLYNLIDKVVKRGRIRRNEITERERRVLDHFSLKISDVRKYLIENYPYLNFQETDEYTVYTVQPIPHYFARAGVEEMRQKVDEYMKKNPWRRHRSMPIFYNAIIKRIYDGNILKALAGSRIKIGLEDYEMTKLGQSLLEISKTFNEEDSTTLFLKRFENEKALRLVNEELAGLARNAISQGYVKRRGSDLEKRIIGILNSNQNENVKKLQFLRKNRLQLGYSELEFFGALKNLKYESKITMKEGYIKLSESAEIPEIDPFTAVLAVTNDFISAGQKFDSADIRDHVHKKFGLELKIYQIEKHLNKIGEVAGFEKVNVKKSSTQFTKSIFRPIKSK